MKNLSTSLVVISVLFVVAVVVGGLSMMRLTAGKGDIQRLAFGTPSPETAGTESALGPAVPVPTVEVKPVLEAPSVVSNVYIEYILDGSGSMMGKLPDGTLKRDVAKEVLLAHLKSFPPGTYIGLRVFGNEIDWKGHEEESCRDIKSIAPVETGQVEKIVTWLGKEYHPRGMTPLAGSIMEAVKDFKASSGRVNSIIVISDGKETCGGDPCKLVEVMKKKGIHFSLHVVGLNVDKATEQELKCIAEKGGGVYKSAKNVQEANEALREIEKRELQQAGAGVTPRNAVVRAEAADVRSGPGTMYSVVGRVRKGEELVVLSRNESGTWLRIERRKGIKGWISSKLVVLPIPLDEIPVEKPATPTLSPIPTPTPTPVPTRQTLHLPTNNLPKGDIESIAFSPDGHILALGICTSRRTDMKGPYCINSEIMLWSLTEGKTLRTINNVDLGDILDLIFLPDGKLLASTGTFRNTIDFWSVKEGSLVRSIKYDDLYLDPFTGIRIALSKNGSLLAALGPKTIKLWHLPDCTFIQSLTGINLPIDISLAPKGNLLVTTSSFPDSVVLKDTSTGTTVRSFKFRNPLSVTFSPDGKLVAAAGDEGIKVWNATTGSLVRSLDSGGSWTKVRFSPDEKFIAAIGDTGARLWDFSKGTVLRSESWQDRPTRPTIAFSPDSSVLVVGTNRLSIWKTGK